MRFFIDHGTIHDKQTGKHICCNDLNEFDIRETVGFLNEQQAAYTAIVEDRNELHRFNIELDKALTESHAENDRLEKELAAARQLSTEVDRLRKLAVKWTIDEKRIQSRDALLEKCEEAMREASERVFRIAGEQNFNIRHTGDMSNILSILSVALYKLKAHREGE